jgi:ubiquitin-small subunit ribosomal protein S27Ae
MTPAQVFLRGVDGGLQVVAAGTVGELRAAAGPEARLVTGARELTCADDSAPLAAYGVLDGATVTALARLVGGGKKRKKKTYTKPKKLKHKHKKVKMAVLSYYKIGDDGKVERLRRECPEDTCGAGVFMAAHHDRHYCGKCGLTYVMDQDKAKA